jgi:hypothetical protein
MSSDKLDDIVLQKMDRKKLSKQQRLKRKKARICSKRSRRKNRKK